MEAPIPEELGLLEPGDHAKHPLLLRIGQFGLKADQVVTGAMDTTARTIILNIKGKIFF